LNIRSTINFSCISQGFHRKATGNRLSRGFFRSFSPQMLDKLRIPANFSQETAEIDLFSHAFGHSVEA
jgi:hypothetical protein